MIAAGISLRLICHGLKNINNYLFKSMNMVTAMTLC